MQQDEACGVTRREFVSTAAGAAVGTILAASSPALHAQAKRRCAIVGTGVRGIGMWGTPIARRYADTVEFVGLSDLNPIRLEAAKKAIFKKNVEVPPYMRLPGSRAGAMSCLTGIAARKSCDEARPIRIADLVKIPT